THSNTVYWSLFLFIQKEQKKMCTKGMHIL
ncbi:MAG: hypothetical protein ACI9B2_001349, partial [Flavobacteriales bacterium]